jgi:ribose transport system permease protein
MVAKRRVSAVIVTLAVNIVIVGIIQFFASGKPPAGIPKVLNTLYNIKFDSLPLPVLFWFILTVGMALFLSRTVFGRNVSSVGDNPIAAHFSGIAVEKTVIIAHTLAGLMAGLSAFVQTSSISLASSKVGLDLPVLAVAATILGGVVFGKGDGGVWGPFFGVLSFALLFVIMTTFNIADSGKLIVQGSIILLAAIYYGWRTSRTS